MFYSTDISVTLWILNKNKKARTFEQNGQLIQYRDRENEVLFMDLRQWGEPYEKKFIQFSADDIAQIARTYHNWQRGGDYHDAPEFCHSATNAEIKQKNGRII